MNEQKIQDTYIQEMRSFHKYIPQEEFKTRDQLDQVRKDTIKDYIQQHKLEKNEDKKKQIQFIISSIIYDKDFGIRGHVSFMKDGQEIFVEWVTMDAHQDNIRMIADGIYIEKPRNKKELFQIYEKYSKIEFFYKKIK